MGGSQMRYDSEGFPDENGKYDSEGFPVESSPSLSAADSASVAKITSEAPSKDYLKRYQEAHEAIKSIDEYTRDNIETLADGPDKQRGLEAMALAKKDYQNTINEISRTTPDVARRSLGAYSTDFNELSKGISEKSGVSDPLAKQALGLAPESSRAYLRGEGIGAMGTAGLKDLLTVLPRAAKGMMVTLPKLATEGGRKKLDEAGGFHEYLGRDMANNEGFTGALANDPTLVPSLAIPGYSLSKLGLLRGATTGATASAVNQGLDVGSGNVREYDPEQGAKNLAIGAAGGMAVPVIGSGMRKLSDLAGESFLGNKALGDLVGPTKGVTEKKLRNAQGEIMHFTPTPYTSSTPGKPTGLPGVSSPREYLIDPDQLVKNFRDEAGIARYSAGMSKEEYDLSMRAIDRLENRLSSIDKKDKDLVDNEVRAWLKNNPVQAALPGNSLRDLAGGDLSYMPSLQLRSDLSNKDLVTLNASFRDPKPMGFPFGLVSDVIKSPGAYTATKASLKAAQKASIPVATSSKEEPKKPRDYNPKLQSLSDLIKGKK